MQDEHYIVNERRRDSTFQSPRLVWIIIFSTQVSFVTACSIRPPMRANVVEAGTWAASINMESYGALSVAAHRGHESGDSTIIAGLGTHYYLGAATRRYFGENWAGSFYGSYRIHPLGGEPTRDWYSYAPIGLRLTSLPTENMPIYGGIDSLFVFSGDLGTESFAIAQLSGLVLGISIPTSTSQGLTSIEIVFSPLAYDFGDGWDWIGVFGAKDENFFGLQWSIGASTGQAAR